MAKRKTLKELWSWLWRKNDRCTFKEKIIRHLLQWVFWFAIYVLIMSFILGFNIAILRGIAFIPFIAIWIIIYGLWAWMNEKKDNEEQIEEQLNKEKKIVLKIILILLVLLLIGVGYIIFYAK